MVQALGYLETLQVLKVTDSHGINVGNNRKLTEVLCNLFEPFLYSYYTVVCVLLEVIHQDSRFLICL